MRLDLNTLKLNFNKIGLDASKINLYLRKVKISFNSLTTMNTNIKIGIISFLIILIIVLFILTKFFISSKKKRKTREKPEKNIYLTKILRLKKAKKDSGKLSSEFSKIVKSFFIHQLNADSDITYGEIINKLRKENKKESAKICENILEYLYSGEQIKREQIMETINEFESIINPKKPKPPKTKKESKKLKKAKRKQEKKTKKQLKKQTRIIKKEEKQFKKQTRIINKKINKQTNKIRKNIRKKN
jgi:hypothetical protein